MARTVNDSLLNINSGTSYLNGGSIDIYGKDHALYAGYVSLKAQNSSNYSQMVIQPSGTFTFNNNGTTKNVAMQEDTIPRSGGAVMTGNFIGRISNDGSLRLDGGIGYDNGSSIILVGKDVSVPADRGKIYLHTANGSAGCDMMLYADGTWTWAGSAVQLVSDQRYKQQIAEIDDKLLDAWEDVTLVQFKYNESVNTKKDKARLHTGYVVQQIDEACKSHNVDISEYGLYCHEVYPERTEEVEVEQADGTKTKETKVIREANEHYSLRYTEALIVECAYLRKCIKELRSEIEQLKSSK